MNDNFFNNKARFFDFWAPFYDYSFTTIFYQAIHKRLLEYVELPANPLVLDIGCGTGRLLQRLAVKFPDLRGIGLDLSPEMLRQARRKNQYPERVIFKQGNANQLPFANNQFKAVFNTISFLHYLNPVQVLQEISRVLREGGYFYLVDYQSLIGTYQVSIFPGGLRFYSPKKREELGKKAGLNCLGHYYLLGPIMLTIFQLITDG
jgi:ubiquinone/menaquinone biosynthesis C-methylase UbiE